jgi:hypothetical protein
LRVGLRIRSAPQLGSDGERPRARALASRDLASEEQAEPDVLERRIDHYAARLVAEGRLWDERDAS